VALIGASKSGKTTLSESLLLSGKIIPRRGRVEDKNTVSDFRDVEHERGSSVFTTLMHVEWNDHKINILDTPGIDDFNGEVIGAMRVADTAIWLINGQHGFEVGTEILWNSYSEIKKPSLFVINQMDHPKVNFDQSLKSLKERLSTKAIVLQYPVNAGEGFNSIIDVLNMTMLQYAPEGGEPKKLPIPADQTDQVAEYRSELMEKVAESDEKLMETYFEKGELGETELMDGLKKGIAKADIFPILCTSATANMGTHELLNFLCLAAPSAIDLAPEKTADGKDYPCDPAAPTTLFFFKTLNEAYLGKVLFFKVCSGELNLGQELYNSRASDSEKINQLYIFDGKSRTNVDKLCTGDIAATVKLKNTKMNDTLHVKSSPVTIAPLLFGPPRTRMALAAINKNEEEKLINSLREIREEDPTLVLEHSKELKQMILSGQGELHLDVTKWKLQNTFGVPCQFLEPKIPYRETIQKMVNSDYRHKKQSGGAGQFGEIHIRMFPYKENGGEEYLKDLSVRGKEEIPLAWGGKLVFYTCIVGGVIDARYVPSVLKGIMDRMEEGPITGSYVRDICVAIYDGKMHPVDSNDISFRIAGSMAFKDGFLRAEPMLLEPIYEIEITAPEDLVGDIMSDLQSRRSIILGIDSKGHYQVVRARTPLAELHRYSTTLKSMTQGKANFTLKFSEYAIVPRELQAKLTKEHTKVEA
jgi:elongation factor G